MMAELFNMMDSKLRSHFYAQMSQHAFNKSVKKTLDDFTTDTDKGLTSKLVEKRQQELGFNELPEGESTPLWRLVLDQFQDQLVIILLVAAFISFGLAMLEREEDSGFSAFVEPIVILLILIANAIVGVVQETNAEKAIEALKQYSPDEARVLRNGEWKSINARELVYGDVVSLSVGDKVPADCRLVKVTSSSFKADQAILTGESFSVEKNAESIIKDPKAVLQDQINMVFSGTSITVGKAIVVVVHTGPRTEMGRIHESISNEEDEKTPLKIALDDFADQLSKIISVICLLVWLINIRHFSDESHGGSWIKGSIYYFKIAVALAVAAIPEGLSVIITTCLALGTQKMAAQGAIVRKLKSVETLGCTSVICSDKTGTLTTNQMSARKVLILSSSKKSSFTEYDVFGNSYGPEGSLELNGEPVSFPAATSPLLLQLSHIASACNDSKVVYDGDLDTYTRLGEPTEAALFSLVEKLGTEDEKFNDSLPDIPDSAALAKLTAKQRKNRCAKVNDYIANIHNRTHLLEFSRDRKSMSVIVEQSAKNGKTRAKSTKSYLYCKGAPETVLERCTHYKTSADAEKAIPLTASIRNSILAKVTEWGNDMSLRVLAFASLEQPDVPEKLEQSDFVNIESGMTFIGLVGMVDPPRAEVFDAIKRCRDAGIRVIVITGDNKNTAENICRQIGVFEKQENLDGKSYTGREFDVMSPSEKLEVVLRANLFARTEPAHKSELVDLLKKQGFIVAMTGDGVNDAPALKKADIGVSMGSGTDVAKLASDMVLADDNFSTIVSAVQEGRSIYSNTKQFIRYLISSNIGEVVSIFLTVVLGMPEALIPVQLLWVNLVTDGLPATALGFNPADNDIMMQPPRDSSEPIVTMWLFFRYMVIGIYVGGATVFGYAWWFMFYEGGPQISFYHLSNFHSCATQFAEIGCQMFTNEMAHKATTMSLSILVVVEMFNAINSLSENESLLTFPLWKNMYLVFAVTLSMVLHFIILYVPFFTRLFAITPLNYDEWMAVLVISFPVVLVDEVLKWMSRSRAANKIAAGRKQKTE